MIAITYPGDANSAKTYGGSTLSILEGLKRHSPDAVGLNLAPPPNAQLKRYTWNLLQLARHGGWGGYQYSDQFLDYIWSTEPKAEQVDAIINMFQGYGDKFFFRTKARRVFYIDQTLEQLFNFYKDNSNISTRQKKIAIEREHRQYKACERIICKSEWAARSLIEQYSVDERKLSILKPGGNIEPTAYANFERSHSSAPTTSDGGEPLKFVFIGKEPARKGLYRFIDALKFVENAEARVRLTVIGPHASEVPRQYLQKPSIDWVGPIDKARDTKRFIELVSSHDVGILMSTIDAGGLSLREFQMLGLAVIAPRVGGSWEMVCDGAGLFVEPTASPVEIAQMISNLLVDRNTVSAMKEKAWAARRSLSLDFVASELLRLAYT